MILGGTVLGWSGEIKEKSELMSRLPLWAAGAQSHWGPSEEIYRMHPRIAPRLRKLGY